MAANLSLLFMGHWTLPYSVLAATSAVIAIIFYFRQFKFGYNINHSLWHTFSAAVSFFCVETFLHFANLF